MLSTIEDAQAWSRQMWEEFKEEYKWLIDLANDISALANQIQMIQNQYEQLAYMYEKTTDLNTSNFLEFAASLGEFTNNVDAIFDQAEGLTATAGDMQDKLDAMMPRIEGMATLDAEHWKDFFAASEEAKHYSVKNSLKGLQDLRKSWKTAKKQLKDLQNQTKEAKNEKQIMKITNEILLRGQVQLKELEMQIAKQNDLLATTAIALENQKKVIANESERVMKYEPQPISNRGAGLMQLK
jgi:P-type conjugative transfer protein TrbJ